MLVLKLYACFFKIFQTSAKFSNDFRVSHVVLNTLILLRTDNDAFLGQGIPKFGNYIRALRQTSLKCEVLHTRHEVGKSKRRFSFYESLLNVRLGSLGIKMHAVSITHASISSFRKRNL